MVGQPFQRRVYLHFALLHDTSTLGKKDRGSSAEHCLNTLRYADRVPCADRCCPRLMCRTGLPQAQRMWATCATSQNHAIIRRRWRKKNACNFLRGTATVQGEGAAGKGRRTRQRALDPGRPFSESRKLLHLSAFQNARTSELQLQVQRDLADLWMSH